jgi:hypothetical protein
MLTKEQIRQEAERLYPFETEGYLPERSFNNARQAARREGYIAAALKQQEPVAELLKEYKRHFSRSRNNIADEIYDMIVKDLEKLLAAQKSAPQSEPPLTFSKSEIEAAVKSGQMIRESGKERTCEMIATRIKEEYKKHPSLDWAEIAAYKIYATHFDSAPQSEPVEQADKLWNQFIDDTADKRAADVPVEQETSAVKLKCAYCGYSIERNLWWDDKGNPFCSPEHYNKFYHIPTTHTSVEQQEKEESEVDLANLVQELQDTLNFDRGRLAKSFEKRKQLEKEIASLNQKIVDYGNRIWTLQDELKRADSSLQEANRKIVELTEIKDKYFKSMTEFINKYNSLQSSQAEVAGRAECNYLFCECHSEVCPNTGKVVIDKDDLPDKWEPKKPLPDNDGSPTHSGKPEPPFHCENKGNRCESQCDSCEAHYGCTFPDCTCSSFEGDVLCKHTK